MPVNSNGDWQDWPAQYYGTFSNTTTDFGTTDNVTVIDNIESIRGERATYIVSDEDRTINYSMFSYWNTPFSGRYGNYWVGVDPAKPKVKKENPTYGECLKILEENNAR